MTEHGERPAIAVDAVKGLGVIAGGAAADAARAAVKHAAAKVARKAAAKSSAKVGTALVLKGGAVAKAGFVGALASPAAAMIVPVGAAVLAGVAARRLLRKRDDPSG